MAGSVDLDVCRSSSSIYVQLFRVTKPEVEALVNDVSRQPGVAFVSGNAIGRHGPDPEVCGVEAGYIGLTDAAVADVAALLDANPAVLAAFHHRYESEESSIEVLARPGFDPIEFSDMFATIAELDGVNYVEGPFDYGTEGRFVYGPNEG